MIIIVKLFLVLPEKTNAGILTYDGFLHTFLVKSVLLNTEEGVGIATHTCIASKF